VQRFGPPERRWGDVEAVSAGEEASRAALAAMTTTAP
jgi:hypothetical protein